jgi:hypothetical protein
METKSKEKGFIEMAYWAETDDNNKVVRVLATDNNDPNGDEGYKWLVDNFGGKWIQTSYNNRIRKQYAGIGFTYDETNDVFIAPQPFPSWTLDENHDWQPPISMPDDGMSYFWDEENQSWSLIDSNL